MRKNQTKLCAQLPRGIGIFALTVLFSLLVHLRANSQQNVPVIGFNSDQVANGTGSPSSSTTASTDLGCDESGYIFVDGTYQYSASCAMPASDFLPASGLIPSTAIPGFSYQLQSYSGNNALRVPATGSGLGSGVFTVTTPVSAGAIYLLNAAAGSTVAAVDVTITFTDATTEVLAGRVSTSWCDMASAANYTKIPVIYNRVQHTTTGCGIATCQYLSEMILPISVANHGKQVASITLDKTAAGAGTVMNVFAVGMVPPCTPPVAQPTGLFATTTTASFISGSFTAASPAANGYLVVRYPQGATPAAPANGTTYTTGQALGTGTVVQASSATAFTANGLTPSTAYDFYVYSYFGPCAPSASNPTYLATAPLTGTLTTNPCGGTISGALGVGPGQAYINLTTALSAIAIGGVSGNVVLELASGYDPTSETYPITFPSDPCASAARTITVRPASGTIFPVVIASNNATATIDLNGARYITFDGRPGGLGTSKLLSIINTNNAGVAIRFLNDASSNTITYCDVQGQNTSITTGAGSAQVGVISFWTANTVAQNGNDSNTISYCDVHATVTGFPAIGIASWGNNATTPASAWNDYNTIDHCNIYDFFSATNASAGIKADGGSNRYTVSSNRLYQTASRTYSTGNIHRGIWLSPSATGAGGFTVNNNVIGGNDSLGAGTYTILGAGAGVANIFWGIDVSHGGTTHSSIQGNTINRISMSNAATSTLNIFRAISTGGAGHMDIGTIAGNMIGSDTANGSISVFNNTNGSIVYGIYSEGISPDSVRIHNNTIAGIITGSSSVNSGVHIIAISIQSGNYVSIDNNLIGSPSKTNSLFASNITPSAQGIGGIVIFGSTYSAVTNNTVINLTNNTASTSRSVINTAGPSYTRGISLSSSNLSIVTGNKVKNVACGNISSGSGNASPLVGIFVNTGNPATVSNNTVDSLVLMNGTTTNATNVDGILIGLNGSTPTNLVTRNFIHHIIVQRPRSSSAVINGLNLIGGANIVANNMIQLGLNNDGTSYDTSVVIRGLYLNDFASSSLLYNNSVYIGGTGVVSGAKNTYAFVRGSNSGPQQFYNNIFVNQRSNATTGGKHYQMFMSAITGASLSNNIYSGSGTGSVFASVNNGTSDVAAFSQGWNSADVNSVSADPRFIAPNGGSLSSTTPVNLHINPSVPSPVEGSGLQISGINDDFDGDSRSGLTPTDIGADAGNFTALDLFGPTISYTAIPKDTVHNGLVLSNFATITDPGTIALGTIAPRLYYKKSTDNNTFGGNTATDNGWKYVTASNTTSPFSFTIDYTILNGGSVAIQNVIQYFVVAQDALNNVGASPVAGFSATSVANVIKAPASPSSYIIKRTALNGSYNVGVGQTAPNFATLTAAMLALNDVGVGSPVTFNLLDASYSAGETFPLTVNAIQGASATNTVTIKPATGVTSAISGSNATAIFILNGADYFTIDGSNNGTTSMNLTITNTNSSTTSAVIWGQTTVGGDGVNNITIKNANIIGSGRAATLVGIGFGNPTIAITSLGTGNNNNTVNNCSIMMTQYGIYDMGASAANKNEGLAITNNRINVNSKAGIYAGFNNNINISANKISDVTNGNTAYGITLGTVNGNTTTITGNEVSNVTISKNVIDSINSSSNMTAFGISVVNSASAGTTNITNNMITRIIGTGTASDFTSGMYVGGGALTTTNIYYNTINLTTPLTGSSRAFAIALDGNNSVMNVKNNIFINQMSGTSAGTYAIGVNYGAFTNLDENYNNYISTGTTAAFAVTGGIFGAGTDQVSLAAWRTATGKGANSKNVAVNFTSASDAHLTGASNGDFNLAGTPVAGITTDIDGNGRHVTYPYMGADEASTPLPVDLLVFAAQAKKGDVLLSWVTASEQNNKGFDVERSVDGKTFTKVDFVKGAGNSARTITYSTTDANAFAAAGARVLYYRLKQVDQNGRYTYSKTVLVSTDSKAEAAAPVAYPNPFTNDLSVTFNASSAAMAHLELLDMGGRVVRSQDVKVTEGMNGAVLTDMSFVQQGLYFLKVTINDHSFMIKVNKQ